MNEMTMALNMVHIVWRDSGAQFPQQWQHVEEYVAQARSQSSMAHTVGFLMHEDPGVILVALTHDPDNDTYYGVQAIDRAAVVEYRFLK